MATTTSNTQDQFAESIGAAIHQEIQKRVATAIEEASITAVRQVRQRILAETADIAATVVERLDWSLSNEQEITIKLKLK